MRIVVANAKGGVGKTTTTMMLASAARLRGLRPVVLDADPQASATLWQSIARSHGRDLGFEVRPANMVTLGIAPARGVVEFVDCPPSGRTFDKALGAADFVIVPSSESATDLQQTWATLETVPEGVPKAVLLCRCETRTRAYREALKALSQFKTPRFDTVIPKSQELKNMLGRRPERLDGYGEVMNELAEAVRLSARA